MADRLPQRNKGQRSTKSRHSGVPTRARAHRYTMESRRYGPAIVVIALLIGGALVAARFWPVPDVVIYQGSDGEVEQLRELKGEAELRPWLAADARHSIRGIPTEAAKAASLELEHMGAVRVLAFGQGISERVAIELPADRKAREKLFEWAAIWERRVGKPIPFDSQQRYLLLHTPEDPFAGSLR